MKNERLISIITPSHNTDDELFRAAFDSVMAQTLDESQIEWVITVHNSTDEHLAFVHSLCDGHEGIKVLELKNDKHTASSPRNHALSHAGGRYITFLDADDRLTPECLATIVSGMEEIGAQVGKFRSEKLEEDSQIVGFLDNRVRFDQTKPLICLHTGDPDMRKLMTMASMMMSSQVVERSFLEEYGVRFREDVRIYEDVVFNMECLSHADTVAVFPQLIGYIYYMHHGSTMQELKAPKPEEVLDTSRDIAFQLRLGVESGLYMRYLFFGHMKQIADMIAGSQKEYGFPDNIRLEIKELLEPFFDLIEPPEPDRKFLTQEQIYEIMKYSRQMVLGSDEDRSSGSDGKTTDVLIDIMRSAEETEIGENWGFDRIRSQEAYESNVPVNEYDTFSPMIELMNRIGESDILFSDSIAGYALTTGTMNVPRSIPYTARTIGSFGDVLRSVMSDGPAGPGSCFLLAGSVKGERPFADRTYPDSLTGAVLQTLKGELTYNSHRNGRQPGIRLTGPEELYFLEAPADPRYLRLLFALLDRDVTHIASPFTWVLLNTFRYLERHHEELADDIEHGTLDGAPWLSHDERDLYSSLFSPAPGRADELRRIFREGFGEPVIRRIWPQCECITAGGSADFSLYTHHLRRYAGDILIRNGAHAASEALIGVDCGKGCYRLEYGESYFEFMPEDRMPGDTDALTAEELEAGKFYEVLLTNRAGLYRYDLHDVILIEIMENGGPVYSLAGRSRSMLKITQRSGEVFRIRPDDMTQLIRNMEDSFSVTIEDYCIAWNDEDSSLRLYIEPSEINGSFEGMMAVSRNSFEKAAEETLRDIVPAYGRAASEERIRPLTACLLQTQTQLAYRDKRMYTNKTTADQIKPAHMLELDPAAQRFFDTFVAEDWK